MGYYVNIVTTNAVIKEEDLDEAYRLMCELNKDDSKKNGGSFSSKETIRNFSWMDANYPDTCKNAREILEELGFDVDESGSGDLEFSNYDSKTGQEDLFLSSISHLITGEIEWRGEDGNQWKDVFGKDGMVSKQGRVVYDD